MINAPSLVGSGVEVGTAETVGANAYVQAPSTYSGRVLAGSGGVPVPTSFWKTDESSGNLADSVASIVGTPAGTITYRRAGPESGSYGVTLLKSHATDAFAFGDNYDLTGTSWSIAGWVNWDGAAGSDDTILYKRVTSPSNSGWYVYVNYAQRSIGFVAQSAGSSIVTMTLTAGVVPTATWFHLAVVRSGTSINIYVNGNLITWGTFTAALPDTTGTLYLGSFGGFGNWFGGGLSQFAIWNGTALTLSQILTLIATPTFTGDPKDRLMIAIGGKLVVGQFMSASWGLGRSDWFSVLSPVTASFTFTGPVNANPNDLVMVTIGVDDAYASFHTDPLWIGRVDTVYTETRTDGSTWTTVTATDPVAILGQAKAPTSVGSGTLDTLTASLALTAGLTIGVDVTDTMPSLLSDSTVSTTVLGYINRMERSSNALLFLQGNGRLKAVQRKALSAGSVTTIPLTALDTPTRWQAQTSVANVINDWSFTNESASWSYAASSTFASYGQRTYSVTDMLTSDQSPYTDLLTNAVLATPRAVVTAGDFAIVDLSQAALWFDPLDWVTYGTDTWQIMSVNHQVTPRAWSVTITADQTQNALVASTDPTGTDPTPPPGTTTVTQTYTSTKSATVFKSSGGATYGNGAGNYLAIGYYGGGRARGLISFPISWTDFTSGGHTFIKVKKATMVVRTSTQVWVAFGSNPKVYVRRATDSWSEGTYDAAPPSQYSSNAVVWPGPGSTTSGQTLKSITSSTNKDVSIDVTDIAQGWYDNGNTGLRIMSANEDSSSNTTEFLSDDSAHPPTLTLVCEVTA